MEILPPRKADRVVGQRYLFNGETRVWDGNYLDANMTELSSFARIVEVRKYVNMVDKNNSESVIFSQVCKHGKPKNICRECGGSSFCIHCRNKNNCKDCGGSLDMHS